MAMSNINIRVDAERKARAQELFSSLGMDMSTAINLFLEQSIEFNGIPFVIRRYNRETEEAMRETEDILSGRLKAKEYGSASELFRELDEKY